MQAKEARKIWEKEIEKEAKVFIDTLEKKILSDTYLNNVSLYYFDCKEFIDLSQATENEFALEVIRQVANYFKNLGFNVKLDIADYSIWIAYFKKDLLRNNVFTENLTNLLEMKKYYRFNLKKNILTEIDQLIRERAKRNRSLEYDITINIPNVSSLLLDDFVEIVNEIKKAGFEVAILCLSNPKEKSEIYTLERLQENPDFIFSESKLRLCIKW